MVFAHGFGCDQNMWRFVAPAFEAESPGRPVRPRRRRRRPTSAAYDPARYDALDGYADDVLEICDALDLTDVVFVGHSVSAMIGVLAAGTRARALRAARARRPLAALHRRRGLPRRLHARGHRGAARVAGEQLPRLVERDGAGDHGQPRPARARRGADEQLLPHRPGDRPALRPRDVPVRQPRRPRARSGRPDARAAVQRRRDRAHRGRRVRPCARSRASTLVRMRATGHCPNLSAPQETIDAIRTFV